MKKRIFFKKKISGRRSLESGFTILELLVVIAIIGLIATIVLVALENARVRARNARRMEDIRQISLAMEMYYDVNERYYICGAGQPVPPSECCSFDTGMWCSDDFYPDSIPGFMVRVPKDPLNNNQYFYTIRNSLGWLPDGSDAGQKFCVYAKLESIGFGPGLGWFFGTGQGTHIDESLSGCGF